MAKMFPAPIGQQIHWLLAGRTICLRSHQLTAGGSVICIGRIKRGTHSLHTRPASTWTCPEGRLTGNMQIWSLKTAMPIQSVHRCLVRRSRALWHRHGLPLTKEHPANSAMELDRGLSTSGDLHLRRLETHMVCCLLSHSRSFECWRPILSFPFAKIHIANSCIQSFFRIFIQKLQKQWKENPKYSTKGNIHKMRKFNVLILF